MLLKPNHIIFHYWHVSPGNPVTLFVLEIKMTLLFSQGNLGHGTIVSLRIDDYRFVKLRRDVSVGLC